MRRWDRALLGDCSATAQDFDIVFVNSDKDHLTADTYQWPFVDNGSFRVVSPTKSVPVSVCSQYVFWLASQFPGVSKTVEEIDIWEKTDTGQLFFFYLPDAPKAQAAALFGAGVEKELEALGLDCKNATLDVSEMHNDADPLDFENARIMLLAVQKRVDQLAAGCEHIDNLHVKGHFGDALMILSPFEATANSSAEILLGKTDNVVFHPSPTSDHLEEWHCGKIDKFLTDNNTSPDKKLTICFDEMKFDLTPSRGKVNPWDQVEKKPSNGFKLDHRNKVTVRNPSFIVQKDGGRKQEDISRRVDAAQELKDFGRVVR